MADQTNQSIQTPEELRQSILEQLDESKKIVEELNDEELEAVSGGFGFRNILHKGKDFIKSLHTGSMLNGAMISSSMSGSSSSSSSTSSGTGN